MKRGYLSVLILLCSIWMSMAEVVNITGTVKKTGGGPLKDVALSLSVESELTATTNDEGKFVLVSPVKTINKNGSNVTPMKFHLRGRELIFNSTSVIAGGKVAVFFRKWKTALLYGYHQFQSIDSPYFTAVYGSGVEYT